MPRCYLQQVDRCHFTIQDMPTNNSCPIKRTLHWSFSKTKIRKVKELTNFSKASRFTHKTHAKVNSSSELVHAQCSNDSSINKTLAKPADHTEQNLSHILYTQTCFVKGIEMDSEKGKLTHESNKKRDTLWQAYRNVNAWHIITVWTQTVML